MRAACHASQRRVRRYCTSTKGEADSATSKSKLLPESSEPSKHAMWQARKKILTKYSYGMLLAVGTTVAVTGYAVANVWYDPFPKQSNLDIVLHMLSSEDLDMIDLGLINLRDVLSTERSTFSGTTSIAYGSRLIEKNAASLVKALVHAAQRVAYASRWRTLSWIDRFAYRSPAFRRELVRQGCVDWLVDLALERDPIENTFKEWYIASHILVLIAGDCCSAEGSATSDDCHLDRAQLISRLSSVADKNSPLAPLVLAELHGSLGLPNHHIQDASGGLGPVLMETAIQHVLPQTLSTSNVLTGASLASSVLFAALGGLWGSIRWQIRLTTTHLRGSQATEWVATRTIGRPLLIGFLVDMFVQRLLILASSERFELDLDKLAELQVLESKFNATNMALTNCCAKINQKLNALDVEQVCLASALTVAENTGFCIFATWLLISRRYAFFPLLAALTYNHLEKTDFPSQPKEKLELIKDFVAPFA